MPQLIINHKNPESLQDTFVKISEDFANIVSLPKEKIYISLNKTPTYSAGVEEDVCMIYVWWKQRDADTKKKVVEAISTPIKEKGVKKVKVTFMDAQPESIHTV